jgi:hypothetical protein
LVADICTVYREIFMRSLFRNCASCTAPRCRYWFVFAGQVAEGEEKVGDDGGDGGLVTGGVDSGGGVDFIGDTDG